MSLRRGLAALLLLGSGCTAATPGPVDTARDYFQFLGRDPLRAIALLSDEFFERQGARVSIAAQVRAFYRGDQAGFVEAPARVFEPEPVDAHTWSLHELQLGWLYLQTRPWFAAIAPRLVVDFEAVQIDASRAEVVANVRSPSGRTFDQRMWLSRSALDASWRIDRIVQEGVAPDDLPVAFVAAPTQELLPSVAPALELVPK